jgi:hypothetical protein
MSPGGQKAVSGAFPYLNIPTNIPKWLVSRSSSKCSGRWPGWRRPSAWDAGPRSRLFYGIRRTRARFPPIFVYGRSPGRRSSEDEPAILCGSPRTSTLLISSSRKKAEIELNLAMRTDR